MATILISGANRGIGLEFCKHYLNQGDAVFACCRNPDSAKQLQAFKQKYSDNLTILTLDVGSTESIEKLSQQLSGQAIDILINNAGLFDSSDENLAKQQQAWANMMLINAIAPYQLTHALTPNLQQGKLKKVINISSEMGSISNNDNAWGAGYRTSKAALNAATKNLAIELKQDQIMVLAIHPGWVQTDMGGEDASLSVNESVAAMTKTIAATSFANSGQFLNNQSQILPW